MARLGGTKIIKEGGLTAKQKEVAHCISRGMTQKEAAAEVKDVSQVTVHNWLRLPAMREYIKDLHCAAIDRAFGKALDRVEKALDDPNVWAQLAAADKIFALRQRISDAEQKEQDIKVILPTQTYLPDSEDDEEDDGIEIGEGTVIEADGSVG
jgi:hypothetical protein